MFFVQFRNIHNLKIVLHNAIMRFCNRDCVRCVHSREINYMYMCLCTYVLAPSVKPKISCKQLAAQVINLSEDGYS